MRLEICLLPISLLITSIAARLPSVGKLPRHLHLSYGTTSTEFIFSWSTLVEGPSYVQYGLDENVLVLSEQGLSWEVKEGRNVQFLHKVTVGQLKNNQRYVYRCGDGRVWSDFSTFQTMPEGSNWSPRLAIFGDLGYENAQSLSRLINDTNHHMYDAVLHVGDFAYDMDSEDGAIGDSFMAEIVPISSRIPYMTSPGNHENWNNFYHYKRRFTMPSPQEDMYYSFDMGPVHFISICTEYYYFLNYGVKKVAQQFKWLTDDLKMATNKASRSERPWIVLFGHRPMYCSNNNHADCTNQQTVTRVGFPFVHWFALEPLLKEYQVDLVIWAHEHSYERLWPVYNTQVMNGSSANPYINPGAPVHIVTGSAGCKERTSSFNPNPPVWSAFRSSDYGYSRMTVSNKTHLYFEQVSDDENGKVIDSFWLVRDEKDVSTNEL